MNRILRKVKYANGEIREEVIFVSPIQPYTHGYIQLDTKKIWVKTTGCDYIWETRENTFPYKRTLIQRFLRIFKSRNKNP